MTRLEHLEKCMRGQFIWNRSGQKIMQTNDEFEVNKDIARTVFVGLADMHGFQAADVQDYLQMEYDSYRKKLQLFRTNWKEIQRRELEGTLGILGDPLDRFNSKVRLCLNSIRWTYKNNPYLKLEDWIEQ